MSTEDEIAELVTMTLEDAERRDAALAGIADASEPAAPGHFLVRWAERVDRALLILARHVAALEQRPPDGRGDPGA